MKSVLLGNGIDIQFGGRAYCNRFIMLRAIFNARTGKYDSLFEKSITGDEIVAVFKGILSYANDILNGKYDAISDGNLLQAVEDFKQRFKNRSRFEKYYEVPLEDWFLLMQIFYFENPDIASQMISSKQAVERIVLDAIYNEGKIQDIFRSMGKTVRRFFNRFDHIFTLNYDNNIEQLCKRTVYHLHGDFSVLADSENPKTAQGFYRLASGQSATVSGFEHCFCTALLDYSGDFKYKRAQANAAFTQFLKQNKDVDRNNNQEYRNAMRALKEATPESIYWISAYYEHPELISCTDYHFSDLISLSGELHIIGMSPQNDAHVFRCIDISSVDKVFYYRYGTEEVLLPLHKPVELVDVSELWERLKSSRPKYNCKINIPNNKESKDFIKVLNAVSFDEITREELVTELEGIPSFIGDPLCKEAFDLIKMRSQEGPPKDYSDLGRHFMEISQIALREGILPSAFYVLLFNYMNKHKTN